MANLAAAFEQSNAQFAIPTSAFFANIQSAATAFSSEVASALTLGNEQSPERHRGRELSSC